MNPVEKDSDCKLTVRDSSSHPVKVVEGRAVLLELFLTESLGVSDEDLVLCLVAGSVDGRHQTTP